MLVPILLLRTSDTEIDGQRIMPNYMQRLVEVDDGEIAYQMIRQEVFQRERLLSAHLDDVDGGPNRYTLARWLSYSSWVINKNWNRYREDPCWWDNFTLRDAMEFERGRRLVELLKARKAQGKKTIVFAHAVFHQQFAARVISVQIQVDLIGIGPDLNSAMWPTLSLVGA